MTSVSRPGMTGWDHPDSRLPGALGRSPLRGGAFFSWATAGSTIPHLALGHDLASTSAGVIALNPRALSRAPDARATSVQDACTKGNKRETLSEVVCWGCEPRAGSPV